MNYFAQLTSDKYVQVIPDNLRVSEFHHKYFKICKDIAGDDQGLLSALVSDLRRESCFISPIQATVKTHKQPGEVKLRVLHNASRHPYLPLA
eukprot:904654-Karenia_brevis.AAC.1